MSGLLVHKPPRTTVAQDLYKNGRLTVVSGLSLKLFQYCELVWLEKEMKND